MVLTGILPIGGDVINFIDTISSGPAQQFRGFGFHNNVGAVVTGVDIWSGSATTLPIPPDIGQQMQVVSTSANDTLAGTGAQIVMLHYIDSSGNQKTENINMNGVAPVLTTATNIRFVNELHVMQAGSSLLAEGTITISQAGAPATIYTQIEPNTNEHLNTARMVPTGKILLIEDWHASAGNATKVEAVDIRLRITADHGVILPRLFHFVDNFMSFNSTTDRIYQNNPIVVPALAIVKCTAYATVAGSNVQATWNGKLINTPQ